MFMCEEYTWFIRKYFQIVKVEVDEADMDTFVLCLANKKVCGKMQKDMADLVWQFRFFLPTYTQLYAYKLRT